MITEYMNSKEEMQEEPTPDYSINAEETPEKKETEEKPNKEMSQLVTDLMSKLEIETDEKKSLERITKFVEKYKFRCLPADEIIDRLESSNMQNDCLTSIMNNRRESTNIKLTQVIMGIICLLMNNFMDPINKFDQLLM